MTERKIKKQAPKSKLSRDYLVRATYSYLQRFATTEKNLAAVLERKVRRRLPEGDRDAQLAEAKGWIVEIVEKAVRQNLVNDHQFASARAASLVRSGHSGGRITQKLCAKGVAPEMAAEVVADLSEQYEDMDFLAAVKYLRKRRFGAFSTRHDGSEVIEKEVASLCRAGFSYGLARRVLNMPVAELEDVLYEAK